MTARHSVRFAAAGFLALSLLAAAITASPAAETRVPVKLSSGRVTIAGTSNIHDYTATTTDVRIVRLQLADGVSGPNFWDEIVKPGTIESFEVAIAAGSLSSPREGLDKNMYKALKAGQSPEIRFHLGLLLYWLNDDTDAAAQWRQVVAASPSSIYGRTAAALMARIS